MSNHLKHGMMTVRPKKDDAEQNSAESSKNTAMSMDKPSSLEIAMVTVLSFIILAVGIVIAYVFTQ